MILQEITLSFTMTINSFEVDTAHSLQHNRKLIKQRAYDMFVNQDEPFDSIHIIDAPDYPALID